MDHHFVRVWGKPESRARRAIAVSALLLLVPAIAEASPLRVQTTLAHLHLLHRAIAAHEQNAGEAPKSVRQLGVVAQLYAQPVPIERGAAVDAWGNCYVYSEGGDPAASPELQYRLYSIGKDGVDDSGQGDDIVSRSDLDPKLYPELFEPAVQLLPMLLLVVFGPVLWAVIRAARRAAI